MSRILMIAVIVSDIQNIVQREVLKGISIICNEAGLHAAVFHPDLKEDMDIKQQLCERSILNFFSVHKFDGIIYF